MRKAINIIFIFFLLSSTNGCSLVYGPEQALRKFIYLTHSMQPEAADYVCEQDSEGAEFYRLMTIVTSQQARELGVEKMVDVDISKLRLKIVEQGDNYCVIKTGGYILLKIIGLKTERKEMNDYFTLIREDNKWKTCPSFAKKLRGEETDNQKSPVDKLQEEENENTPYAQMKERVTIGVILDVVCDEQCRLTLLSKNDNKKKDFWLWSGADVIDDAGHIKQEYRNAEVKVTWQREENYIYGDSNKMVDVVYKVEILE